MEEWGWGKVDGRERIKRIKQTIRVKEGDERKGRKEREKQK